MYFLRPQNIDGNSIRVIHDDDDEYDNNDESGSFEALAKAKQTSVNKVDHAMLTK